MAETRSMTRNPNLVDASSKNTFQTCDNGGVAPWSDINHDMLFLVMMQLGVIDFVAFSGVCKSWRSLSHSNRKMFMASRLPMSIWISDHAYKKESYCYLEDFEGRKFKTPLPDYGDDRDCIGLTCGYLVFYAEKTTRDFWLVNVITRHELNFPSFPSFEYRFPVKAVLIFSPSISRWVLVVFRDYTHAIWFSTWGKGEWNHVPSPFPIIDLHAFRGKIYTLNAACHLCEMRLDPEPKLTLLQDICYWNSYVIPPKLASSGENLYLSNNSLQHPDIIYKLDFGKIKWVSPEENTIGEYAFFVSFMEQNIVINPESWAAHLRSQCKRYEFFPNTTDKSRKGRFFVANMWYFPDDCLDVNFMNE